MSTVIVALSDILAPLQGLRRWFAPITTARPPQSPKDQPVRDAIRPPLHKPLRILRVVEAGQAPTQVGRMIISGRMADVCAELDRLAARH